MNKHEGLSYMASLVAIGVLAAMWLCKDAILATVKLPTATSEKLRLWSLKARRLQDYEGRHRRVLA